MDYSVLDILPLRGVQLHIYMYMHICIYVYVYRLPYLLLTSLFSALELHTSFTELPQLKKGFFDLLKRYVNRGSNNLWFGQDCTCS